MMCWRHIGVAYVTATSTALATAVGLNLYTKKAPPLVARWVKFADVAAANCVNIPMMRQQVEGGLDLQCWQRQEE
ncbi:Sideroflexin-2 [Characodon lateralis]|uniref:Sideroflexin-2 n=1 Tax=Characodon lateralis TaxID=208331 RepID=A0ABU7ELT2_9TELE|nr:Sideroflexin-2 [Characodon lateralis]